MTLMCWQRPISRPYDAISLPQTEIAMLSTAAAVSWRPNWPNSSRSTRPHAPTCSWHGKVKATPPLLRPPPPPAHPRRPGHACPLLMPRSPPPLSGNARSGARSLRPGAAWRACRTGRRSSKRSRPCGRKQCAGGQPLSPGKRCTYSACPMSQVATTACWRSWLAKPKSSYTPWLPAKRAATSCAPPGSAPRTTLTISAVAVVMVAPANLARRRQSSLSDCGRARGARIYACSRVSRAPWSRPARPRHPHPAPRRRCWGDCRARS